MRLVIRATAGVAAASLAVAWGCGSDAPAAYVWPSYEGGVDTSVATDSAKPDAPDAAQPDAGVTYNDLTDPNRWEAFSTTSVAAAARGFSGVAFDGHYVYLVPYDNQSRSGVVARYDPSGPFGAAASWATYDVASLGAAARGFVGSAFDGRYLYLAQYNYGGGYDGIVARFDTSGDFTSSASWLLFDTSSLNAAAAGFSGAVFDGRYVYLVPHYNGSFLGVIARYDTRAASFKSPGAWATYDIGAAIPNARGFQGGTFDGRYLYLTPWYNDLGYSSLFVRYDTTAALDDAAAWTSFDTTSIDPVAIGYSGAAFDGRYVYYAPAYNVKAGKSGDVARFDTTGAFGDKASWSTFDVSKTNPAARSYSGLVFDGRYLTLIPNGNGVAHGVVARYDTLASFTTVQAWQTYDLTTFNPGARGFTSGGFDGRYLYMPEYTLDNGLTVRFDAKSPPSIPRSYSAPLDAGVASFF